ncbi:ribonuclease H-like domain-containing protein [Tanacetum coccineum]
MSQPANDDYSHHFSDDEASYHEDASDNVSAAEFMLFIDKVKEGNEPFLLWVFEQEIKGASKTSTSAQNVAFVSQSRSSTNKVKSGLTGTFSTCNPSTSSSNIPKREAHAGFADEVIYSLFAKQSKDLDLLHEDLEQIDDLDIEEMDINWQIAMIAIRMKKFYKKTGRRVRIDGNNTGPQKPEISDSDDNSTERSTCQSNDSEGTYGNTSKHSSESESESIKVKPSCAKHVKTPRQQMKNQGTSEVKGKNWNYMLERELGEGSSLQESWRTERGIFDSGCLGHMTGNKDHLDDFKECKGGVYYFGRFSWVFFLATKDETSGILQNFIRQIENQLNQMVKIIRSDNGTEFKNRDMLELCGNRGIKQEYSNAKTLQQNGVAERINKTLIEAARTMLADSLLPTSFWA